MNPPIKKLEEKAAKLMNSLEKSFGIVILARNDAIDFIAISLVEAYAQGAQSVLDKLPSDADKWSRWYVDKAMDGEPTDDDDPDYRGCWKCRRKGFEDGANMVIERVKGKR